MRSRHSHTARYATIHEIWRVAQPPRKSNPEWKSPFSSNEYNRGYTPMQRVGCIRHDRPLCMRVKTACQAPISTLILAPRSAVCISGSWSYMPTRRCSSTQSMLILVLALPLILAGCGGGTNSSPGGATPAAAAENVTVTINPAQTHAISPYIYGINDGVTGAPTDLTFARRGG